MGFLRALVIIYMLIYITLYLGLVGALVYIRSIVIAQQTMSDEVYGMGR